MKIEENTTLRNKKILVIASGSIAAVKTPLLISNLIKTGAEVRCVLTTSASKLVSPLSLSTLSRHPCYQDHDQWNPEQPRPLHISLSEWADLIIVAPLSASSLYRWTNGDGEGLAASILLASEKPVIAAAAMNTGMWNNPAVKRNWKALNNLENVIALAPSEGLLACDRIGDGRMASPEIIQLATESANIQIKNGFCLQKDWTGINLLISAGATIEDIDAARCFTNRSSGKMGVLLGQAARFRGASVTLVHAPLQIEKVMLEGIKTVQVRSARDMQETLKELQSSADVIAMAAGVSDIRTSEFSKNRKDPKCSLVESLKNTLELVPDLLSELITKKKSNQIFLGFTALTGTDKNIKELAIIKKANKGCDLMMANPIDRNGQGFESNFNGGWLIGPKEEIKTISVDSKLSIAHELLDALKNLLVTK